MASKQKFEKFKGIVSTLFSPKGSPAQASEKMVGHMENRKEKLEKLGSDHTGGMFDIIFKKRKERERAVRGIEE